jgi:hypothetical protein
MIMAPVIFQKRLLGSFGSFNSLLGENEKKREKNATHNFRDARAAMVNGAGGEQDSWVLGPVIIFTYICAYCAT